MNTRRRTLRRDAKGYFRPYIGWRADKKQHRFNLGTDERLAQARYAQIQALYEGCGEYWTEEALELALHIAKGERATFEPPPIEPATNLLPGLFPPHMQQRMAYARAVERLKAKHPSIDIAPANPEEMAASAEMNDAFIQYRIASLQEELEDLGALAAAKATVPDLNVTGTLHDSLRAYIAHIERDGERLDSGKLKPHPASRIKRAERLIEHHQDFPLHRLDYDKCAELIGHWRNRPNTKRGNRSSRDDARHVINEIIAFLRWLDRASYGWTMPRGALEIKRKVMVLESEKKKAVVSKDVYSVDELATIAKHATEWERLALLVGLNCAAGAAELGRMTWDMVLLNHKHEYSQRLRFHSTEQDSFIRMYRPKTDVFGEWILWPETVKALLWAKQRAKQIESNLIFVRRTGSPLYNENNANPQAAFASLWRTAVARAQKHVEKLREANHDVKKLKALPFGTLRDTLPDTLRHTHSDELASLCLAHGKPTKGDSLLECYGNRPYGRLHDAIRQLREHFKKVLDPDIGGQND